jgi:tetratricopeptide (TPR) repeat protein
MRLLLAALTMALLAAPARADDREEAALQHLDVGVAAYRAGDYAAARREFERARDLVPDRANPYRWLGMANVQLGDCTQALLAFEMFLKRVPPGDERVPGVTRLRDECERPRATAPAATPAMTPTPTPAATVAATARERKPLTRRWWFWTALGGAAALTATGITLGVVLGTPHEARLPAIVCGTTGCAGTM